MGIVKNLDLMIDDLISRKTPPEYIIMGRGVFHQWMIEISGDKNIDIEPSKKKYKFSHRNIPVIICDSEILEVIPNAKFMLNSGE